MKNKLQFELIQLLVSYNLLTADQMATHLNISNKTVRSYLHKSISILESFNIELIRTPGVGYSLKGEKECILNLQNYLLDNIHKSNNLMKDDRIIFICYHLLKYDSPIYIRFLENKLFISRSSIYSDIEKVSILLKKYNLTVTPSRKHGIILNGSEIDKRNALYELINNCHNQSFYSFDNEINEYISSYYQSDSQTKKINQLIQKVEKSNHIKIAHSDIDYIVVMIQICINRIKNSQFINLNEEQKNYYRKICNQKYLENINNYFNQYFSVQLNEDEILYLTTLFFSLKNTLTETINTPLFFNQATAIVKEFSPFVYHLFPILDKSTFENGLIQHLTNYLEKSIISYDYQNPYTLQIKKEFGVPYTIAQNIIKIASKYTSCTFPDDEIAFIAIHIASAIEKSLQPLRVLFLYEHRFSELKFSSSLIEAHIKEINIIDKMKYQDYLLCEKLPVYDIIFTTFPLDNSLNVPIYRIPVIPNKQFIHELRELVRNYFIKNNPAHFSLENIK